MPDIDALQAECSALRNDQTVLALGLSHDLRAPLRAIDSFAYLLEQRSAQALDDTGRDHLHRIREASARMGRLLARLQVYLHAGSAPLHVDDLDLTLLADWCVAELRDAAPDREAHIDIAPNLRARGDERLLKTAIAELLHNAWTYAAADRPVHIVVDAEQSARGTTLRIRDHGEGFDPALATRLGEPFQRLSAQAHPEGCGLGVAIARRIAQRHGGTVQVEGRIGEGATASLFMPNAAEPE
ncbi:ATP-binding protein [Noviluteimonas gilva]|uniref:ATP-binding protein n=1 Tax=Noviluteimonas gilva TaxID=2682097 RepID=UPI0018D26AEB